MPNACSGLGAQTSTCYDVGFLHQMRSVKVQGRDIGDIKRRRKRYIVRQLFRQLEVLTSTT